MIQHTSFLFFLLLLGACTAPKPSSSETKNANNPATDEGCTTIVQATDYSSLDGCQILMVAPNQMKYLVMENNTAVEIIAGRSYKIGFEIMSDGVSTCMRENGIIRVHCLEPIEIERPELKDCWVMSDALEVPFLKKIIETQQPLRILRHDFRGGAAYQVDSNGRAQLYDCQGNDMCKDLGKSYRECLSFFKTDFGESKIIYQGEGPQD